MSIIKNNTSSPFRMKYSSPVSRVSYEFPSTEATYGSNEGVVAAISGIGKIAGAAITAKKAKKGLEEAESLKADVNKTKKKTTLNNKIEEINKNSTLQEDALATSQKDFGLSTLPKLSELKKR